MSIDILNAIQLDHYALLRISGRDRHEFLQGQLTQDVGKLTPSLSVLAGWANAKGRLLLVGQLIDWQDGIHIPVPADAAPGIVRRLSMFVLRADVRVEVADLGLVGLTGIADQPVTIEGLEIPADAGACRHTAEWCVARLVGDPARAWLIGRAPVEVLAAGSRDWQLANIRAGLPEVFGAASEQFTPQMLNLDVLGAISFTKGCYVGQEIVARTQNLGRIKRRMYRFTTDMTGELEPGQMIYGPGSATGKIVTCAQNDDATEMLAVVAIESAGGEWFSDESRRHAITRQPLPYTIPEKSPA